MIMAKPVSRNFIFIFTEIINDITGTHTDSFLVFIYKVFLRLPSILCETGRQISPGR